MDNLFDTDTDYQEVEDNGTGCEHDPLTVDAEGYMFCSDCGLTQMVC